MILKTQKPKTNKSTGKDEIDEQGDEENQFEAS